MQSLIRFIDRQLRRRMHVFEYCERPDCLFRARLLDSRERLPVPGGEIAPGTPVLELHLWNEHLPPLSADGPDMAWATRGARRLTGSCRDLAARLDSDPRFARVEAIGGSHLLSTELGRGVDHMLEYMGFAVTHPPPGAAGHGLGAKIHACMMMWAYNPASLRGGRWRRMRPASFWVTRKQFLDRYGRRAGGRGATEPAGAS